MIRSRLESLASPVLIACVLVLAVNDWVLKPALHNALTGKLSDVAGVAAFALFWAALFPRHRAHAYVTTAMGFAWWKSPASQPLIDAWNAAGWMPVGRVVDWTDLLALAVLPLLYRYHARPVAMPRLRRVMGPVVAAACVLAFGATSQFRAFSHPLDAQYAFELPPDSLLQRMYELRTGYVPWAVPPGRFAGDGRDTLRLVVGVPYAGPGGRWPVTIQAELARTAEGGSVLRPREAATANADFQPADALRELEAQVIEPLRRNRPNTIHHEQEPAGNRPRIAPRILSPGELYVPRGRVRVSIAEAAFLALVEVTPRLEWHVIYPVTEDDERLLPAGDHTLTTLCHTVATRGAVPPGEDVPACAIAQRMTLEDSRRLHDTTVPNPCPTEYASRIGAVRPGMLFLVAADGPMPRAELEATLGTFCSAYPRLEVLSLERAMDRMRVRHWAGVEAYLRR